MQLASVPKLLTCSGTPFPGLNHEAVRENLSRFTGHRYVRQLRLRLKCLERSAPFGGRKGLLPHLFERKSSTRRRS